MNFELMASMMCADYGYLEKEVRELENAQKILESIPDDVLAQYRTAVKEENAYSHQK